MDYKRLGDTAVMIPEIGLGTWKYRGGVEPLRKGIELGATLIDTAESYRTEDVVGRSVDDVRDQVFIASKVSGNHLGFDDVLRAAEGSLFSLDSTYLDLFQIHWPSRNFPIKETMHAMEELVDRKQIKYIGVSNFSVHELQEAQAAMRHYPIVSNQVLYNLNRRSIEHDLLPYCQEHDVTILAYTPLDSGRLASRSVPFRGKRIRTLEQIAAQVSKSLGQVALNWCVSRPNIIAIPKSDSVERTIENCQASGWRLSQDQVSRLDAAFS